MIDVDPIEELFMDNGAISDDSKTYNVSMPNHRGVQKSAKLSGGSVIQAKWTPFGNSNRDTAPDVQAKETVMILSYADTQDYYWTTMFREPSLRRLERVRYMFSNLPGGSEAYGEDTSYYLEVSTIDKRIKLHTSDNDGEAAAYDITIDTQAGTVTLEDNLNNNIKLESVSGRLTGNIQEEIILNTKKYKVNASESYEVVTKSSSITADTSLIKADTHTEDATSTVTNGLNVKQGAQGKACTFEGSINIDGNIDATGSIMDGGGNSNHHSH